MIPDGLPGGIIQLNEIRNYLVHNLEVLKLNLKIKDFIDINAERIFRSHQEIKKINPNWKPKVEDFRCINYSDQEQVVYAIQHSIGFIIGILSSLIMLGRTVYEYMYDTSFGNTEAQDDK
ncbi:MAG: hypothetical protein AB7F75_07040 [Planctomycetota bacterium]